MEYEQKLRDDLERQAKQEEAVGISDVGVRPYLKEKMPSNQLP